MFDAEYPDIERVKMYGGDIGVTNNTLFYHCVLLVYLNPVLLIVY